mmetsp:Transcript_32595/g.75005  ORF Transcript_32595/g.75005 Transcript_32595/m.75005 type:complete len:236 (+) Transcript_32595:496-1203(+)
MIDATPRNRTPLKRTSVRIKKVEEVMHRGRGAAKAKKGAYVNAKRGIAKSFVSPHKRKINAAIAEEKRKADKQANAISKKVSSGKLVVVSRKNGMITLGDPAKLEKESKNKAGDKENQPSKKMIKDAVTAMKQAGLNTKGKRIVISFQEPGKKVEPSPDNDNTFVFSAKGQVRQMSDSKKKGAKPVKAKAKKKNLKQTLAKKDINTALKAQRGRFPDAKERSDKKRQNKFNKNRD